MPQVLHSIFRDDYQLEFESFIYKQQERDSYRLVHRTALDKDENL